MNPLQLSLPAAHRSLSVLQGSAAKQGQFEDALENLKKIDDDLKQLGEQLATLNAFPDFHPKKKAYMQRLLTERDEMARVRQPYQKKVHLSRARFY